MNELEVKFVGSYNKIGSYTNGNPYSIWFIYPQKGKPFIIKGGARSLDLWVERSFSDPSRLAIVNKTYWCHGEHRSFWGGINMGYYVQKLKSGKFEIYAYPKNRMFCGVDWVKKIVRKPPRKWLKDIDKYFERNVC